jgi:hypothetical protein
VPVAAERHVPQFIEKVLVGLGRKLVEDLFQFLE